MIKGWERDRAPNLEIGEAASSFSVSANRGLVTFLNSYLPALKVSIVAMLLGGLIVFIPLIDGGTTHLPVLIMRLTILGSVLAWTIHQMRHGTIVLNRSRIMPILVIFLLWAAVSVLWAPYKNAGVQWFISLLFYAALFGLVWQGIRTSQEARHVLMVFVAMGFCEGVLGIAQYVWLGEARAKGTFFNPNFFATYQVAVLSLVFGLLCYCRTNEMATWQRVALWSTAFVSFGAFLMAQSRGALVALCIATIFISWYRFGNKAFVILTLCLLVGVVVPSPLKQRMTDVPKHDPYAFSRAEIWKNSVERILDHPWGIGLAMYKYASFRYRFPIEHNIVQYGKRAESAHNEYLQMAVELGVAGIAIFLVGIGVWMWEAMAVLRGTLKPWERGFVVGAIGVVFTILAHSAVDSVFHEPALVVILIVFGSLVLGFRSTDRPLIAQRSIPCSSHPMRHVLILFCGLSLVVLIVQPAAGWYAFSRGETHAKAGQQDLALQWFERASQIDPGTTGYHDAVARASIQHFQQSGDPQWLLRAVEEERLAIELNPLDGRFPYRLGTILDLFAQQKMSSEQQAFLLQQAVDAYNQAVHADPYSPLNYMGLANILLPLGRVDEAKARLKQAIAYEPNFLPARVRLAELSLKDRDFTAAQSEFNSIVATKNKYKWWVLSELEHEFLDVDPSPLRKALSPGGQP
jgi:tetratricopeptide (TPR) repeat protein